jgi:hypothetical protein
MFSKQVLETIVQARWGGDLWIPGVVAFAVFLSLRNMEELILTFSQY